MNSLKRWPVARTLRSLALCPLVVLVLAGSGPCGSPALAEDLPIGAFYGTYEGQAFTVNHDGLNTRDISVSIKPHGDGFNISWVTAKQVSEGKINRKTYSIDFEGTNRPGIFGSAMQRNKFGHSVPLDPLKGDPYVWSRITGKTLTVYALIITVEGSYEMQIYHRTLSDKGMDLEFTRYREGEPVRVIAGTLVKVGG